MIGAIERSILACRYSTAVHIWFVLSCLDLGAVSGLVTCLLICQRGGDLVPSSVFESLAWLKLAMIPQGFDYIASNGKSSWQDVNAAMVSCLGGGPSSGVISLFLPLEHPAFAIKGPLAPSRH